MARKNSRSHTTVLLEHDDDFKLIRGIGTALEGRLHNADILTYNQLSSLSPDELAIRVAGLSARQIIRQDWIGQARKLASKNPHMKPSKKKAVKQPIRQHYENYTIEFLLDEKNVLRRTRVVHIQSGDADTWAGWEDRQLLDFLARHTNILNPARNPVRQENSADLREESQNVTRNPGTRIDKTPAFRPISAPEYLSSQAGAELLEPILQSPTGVYLAGTCRLRDLKVLLLTSDIPIFSIRRGQPYIVRLTLDLSDVHAAGDMILTYNVIVNFKQLGGPYCTSGEIGNSLTQAVNEILNISGPSLRPGIYRVDAFARLVSDEGVPGLTAYLKGDLLQVY